jgi:hypothetical protein
MLLPRLARRPNPRLALTALPLATAALTLAACGSDTTTVLTTGSTTTPTTTTAPTTTTTPTTSTTTSSTATSSGATTSDLREAFDAALRQNLVQQQNLSNAQANCVLDELRKTLPDSQIEATVSGQVPKAVTNAAFKAGLTCANK